MELQIEILNRSIINIKSKFEQEKKQLILNLHKSFKTLSSEVTYKKELKFNQEMKGIAEIITEDMSLLERLFSKFKTIELIAKMNLNNPCNVKI